MIYLLIFLAPPTCNPVKINERNISSLMYADDLVILSENSSRLQTALNKLN